jgi:hypothetical protein
MIGWLLHCQLHQTTTGVVAGNGLSHCGPWTVSDPRDTFILYMKMTNKMQLCRIIYYSLPALHVSSDIFAHHQDHLNCITASGVSYYVAANW